jgi:hypothetical protein
MREGAEGVYNFVFGGKVRDRKVVMSEAHSVGDYDSLRVPLED